MKERKRKKDGPIKDLADFEYDSKKQIFRKKEKIDDDVFSNDDSTDPDYSYLSQNHFHSNN